MSFYVAWLTLEQKYDLIGKRVPWYLWPWRHRWIKVRW